MQSTRFSAPINSAWKDWYDEQEGVHMPLQTVMRARNGQPTDWSLTPAPRPIELPALADAKPAEEKNNTADVILESGLITNQPASLGTEQQVAFSVWALGRTGSIASATSSQKISTPQPKVEDSAPPATASAAEVPANQPSSAATAGNEPSKAAVVVPAGAIMSNTPPAETGKPTELVFVTNTSVEPAVVPETAVREGTPAGTPQPVSATPPPPRIADLPASQPLVAQARAADPSQEEKSGPALATPPRGFLHDNIKPLALMIVAGFGALYCFSMWLRTNARPKGNAFSLTRTGEGE
jgi:hypothetical protein